MIIDTLSLYEKLKDPLGPEAAGTLVSALANTVAQVEQVVRSETNARLERIEQALGTLVQITQHQAQETAELRQVAQANTQAIVELRETVTRLVETTQRHSEEITELRQVAQANTQAIVELRETVTRLVETTQRHSEEITELRQVAQANTQAIVELRETVTRLVETTQRHSEEIERVNQTVNRLAQVVEQHAREMRRMDAEQREIRREIGGLAFSVGYRLENEAYVALPSLLRRDYGLEVRGRLKRDYIVDKDGKYLEVNILGEATRENETVTIVGESKVQLSSNDIDRFIRRKLQKLEGVYPNLFPVIVTHMISSPEVREYARLRGVALYFSYDFQP